MSEICTGVDYMMLMSRIEDVIIKTLIAAELETKTCQPPLVVLASRAAVWDRTVCKFHFEGVINGDGSHIISTKHTQFKEQTDGKLI